MKYILAILALVVVGVYFAGPKMGEKVQNAALIQASNLKLAGSEENEIETGKILKIGSTTLNIQIADTDSERELGLSYRESLASTTGLLFIFEIPGQYGFWMKDMNFPIDMAWLDENKKIIHIETNVSPETYVKNKKVFFPPAKSLYVLETAANWFQNSKIKIGDIAEF